MGVGAEGESGIVVAQHAADGFDINAVLECYSGECVPIGYNKDKSGNLVIAMGFGFVLILFPPKKPLKMGLEQGGDKAGCHIKDKNIWEIMEDILWHMKLK